MAKSITRFFRNYRAPYRLSIPNMTTLTLNDGSKIPWIAFGTGTALFGQDAANSVRQAIDTGFEHLDGAQAYNNEESLGAGIKASGKPRSELYVVTKLSPSFLNAPGRTVKDTLLESLKKLGVEHVDLFLIHSPQPSNEKGTLKQLWEEMEAVQKEGLAKSIGVSNFRVEDLKVILDGAKIVPAVNQIELHPYVWKAAEPIVTLCKEHGITPASYGGLVPLTRAAGGPLDAVLPGICERLQETYGKPVTPAQLLSKWIQSKGAIVVTTSSKRERLQEYLATSSVPELTAEEIQAIEEAGSKLHKRAFMRQVFGE